MLGFRGRLTLCLYVHLAALCDVTILLLKVQRIWCCKILILLSFSMELACLNYFSKSRVKMAVGKSTLVSFHLLVHVCGCAASSSDEFNVVK